MPQKLKFVVHFPDFIWPLKVHCEIWILLCLFMSETDQETLNRPQKTGLMTSKKSFSKDT